MRIVAFVLSLAAAALAQSISIGAPTEGETLTAGLITSISVIKPDTLTGSTEIGIGILLHHCTQTPCEDATEILGSILYAGPFNPQRGTGFFRQPLQNFSVEIPEAFQSGPAVLSVAHANLIGAGPFLFTEIANVTVNVD